VCGIAGILNFNSGHTVDRALLERINQKMVRRGPDKSGFWYSTDQQVGLSHNRLSFIDLHSRSDQPLSYLDQRYVITYNGEIYNYKELSDQLIKKGYSFKTSSDTEIIMAMYDCFGAAMLLMLRGMFSFVIWDSKEQMLFAARDPFGVKPFYYYRDDKSFVFASQVKAISAQPQFTLAPSPGGWCGFIAYGSVPEPFTTFQEIATLPAGHYLQVDKSGKFELKEYFSIYDEFSKIENSSTGEVDYDRIDQALSDSVTHHLVADVPVGLFLSSGIDSTVLASYLQQSQKTDLIAFTLDFDEFEEQRNESRYARVTAEKFNLNHQVINFDLVKMESLLEEFFASMDQPSIDGLNVWMISKAVSDAGYRAVLSGLGADEILAGYPSFNDVPKYSKTLSHIQRISNSGIPIDKLINMAVTQRFLHPKIKGFGFNTSNGYLSAYQLKRNLFLPTEIDLFFDGEILSRGKEQLEDINSELIKKLNKVENSYLKVSALELDNYMKNQLLRDADWASMHHSLELRVPFVDWPLINVCASELVKLNKPSKRKVIQNVLNGRLPDGILSKTKTGFETPAKHWLNTMPNLQGWKSQQEFQAQNTPWARRWAYEVKNRFLN